MRHAPLKPLPHATLVLTLLCGAGYPLAAHHDAPAAARAHGQTARPPQQQPTPRPRLRPTPTPSPTPKRGGIQTTQTPTPTPTPTPKQGGLSTGEKIAIGGILGAAVGGGILISKSGGGVSEGDLSKNGPAFPSVLKMSDIQVTGFLKGGWPFFLAYELEQPAVVTLTIKADKVDPFVQRLEGSPGANEIRLTIPARFGSGKPRVTKFTLTAVSNTPSARAPVEFVSVDFSAGPGAVGSVGINNVSFEPGDVFATAQSQRANYKFHSLFDFDRVTADFMLIGRNDKREIVAKRVGQRKFDKGIKRDGWLASDWDCRDGKKVSQGRHQLQVRGWTGLQQGGSWVATMSKQFVRIQ